MIFEAAGRVGIDPRPFTWQQVDDMDHGKRREQWQHTGDICYVFAQANSKATIDRDLFNRYERSRQAAAKPARTIKPSELVNIG